jgi:hypothetical protein
MAARRITPLYTHSSPPSQPCRSKPSTRHSSIGCLVQRAAAPTHLCAWEPAPRQPLQEVLHQQLAVAQPLHVGVVQGHAAAPRHLHAACSTFAAVLLKRLAVLWRCQALTHADQAGHACKRHHAGLDADTAEAFENTWDSITHSQLGQPDHEALHPALGQVTLALPIIVGVFIIITIIIVIIMVGVSVTVPHTPRSAPQHHAALLPLDTAAPHMTHSLDGLAVGSTVYAHSQQHAANLPR